MSIALLLIAPAWALEPNLGADVKTFITAKFAEQHLLFTPDEDPVGSGVADGRLKFDLVHEWFSFQTHGVLTVTSAQPDSSLHTAALAEELEEQGFPIPEELVSEFLANTRPTGLGTGVGGGSPEAVDLTWRDDDQSSYAAQARIDRLVVRASVNKLDVALGRQAITFGAGQVFSPMDLVSPFNPTIIDSEYKPGVDAVRVDGYPTAESEINVIAAYAGGWDLDGMILMTRGQVTVGATDLSVLAGAFNSDPVVGTGVVTSIGAVGLHNDVTLSLPESEDPFVRAVLGSTLRPTPTTTVTGEVYVQTFGADDPDSYLEVAADPHFVRGEWWLMGRYYGALALSQEVTPLVLANLSVVANLGDASALIGPNTVISVSENSELVVGAMAGLGARPEEPDLPALLAEAMQGSDELGAHLGVQSEFGLVPLVAYLQMKAYF